MPKPQESTFHGHPLVGPFPGRVSPTNGPGLYARRSPRSHHLAMAWWDGRRWSKFATTPERALEIKHRPSKFQSLEWFGFTKAS